MLQSVSENRALTALTLTAGSLGTNSKTTAGYSAFKFRANGATSTSCVAADAPNLNTATLIAPNAPLVGNLAFDNSSGGTATTANCQIFTLVATQPTDISANANVPTFAWLAGTAFSQNVAPRDENFALPNKSNEAAVGFLMIKNNSSAVFVPGTTQLAASGIVVSYFDNLAQAGA